MKWIKSLFRRIFLRRKPQSKLTVKPVLFMGDLAVKIVKITGFNEAQERFARDSLMLMLKIINSQQFKDRVCAPPFILEYTRGMSSVQLYEYFMSGKTTTETGYDRQMNITLRGYYTRRNTIGYVITGDRNDAINFNKKFFRFDKHGKATLASNIIHEDRHNAGFFHESRGYSRRNIPYFYGDVVRDLALKYINNEIELTDVKRNGFFSEEEIKLRTNSYLESIKSVKYTS